MNNLPDRAKMRRKYLRRKVGIYTKAVGGSLLCICGVWAIAIIGISVLFLLGIDIGHTRATDPFLPIALFFLVILVTVGLLGSRAHAIIDTANEEAAKHELDSTRAEALPSEVVLLRGSQAPPSWPQELLRPAGTDETPADELLRAGEE